ncbi:PIN domain-containing protein [Pseudonocardia kunmingensis]|uniref:Ribonuclease VapC n=1 Tax=Pseudonocardia kunmingensis TaxID=630975 RepID=A0A543CY61_9PSEU|nr:PIN domain-containing protein [Pseudonocardia kunmingensis]TQM02030.1 tRNA(fMet)-specific endonuclease VapC [Pseudonocardia kunmingensis]
MARLILDTGVLVAGVRGSGPLGALARTDDVGLPAIAVAEYLAGTLLDADPGRSAAQRAFLDEILQVVPVLDYDEGVAEHHAALLAHTRRSGEACGAHDLIIAATARSADRTIVTTDARAGFGELPGVEVRVVRP